MNILHDSQGIILVLLGTLCLLAAFLARQTSHNWVMLAALAMIIAGVILHIFLLKRQSKY